MKIKLLEILKQIIAFYQKLRVRELPFFNNKKVKITGIVLGSLLMLLLLLPFFVNSATLKAQIEEDVSKTMNATLTINSDITISFLPASISATNVVLEGYQHKGKTYNVFAKVAHVDLSFFDMLRGNIDIKEISLTHAVLETYHSLNVPLRNNGFTNALARLAAKEGKQKEPVTTKHASKNKSKYLSQLPVEKLDPSKLGKETPIAFHIENSEFVSYDKARNITRMSNIFSDISLSKNAMTGYGEFISLNLPNRFSFDINLGGGLISHDSYFRLTSPIVDVKIDGTFVSQNKGIFHSDFDGMIKAKIFRLKNFYRSYVGSNRAIYEKLKPGANLIGIEGKISSKDGEAEISNISINSDIMHGKGQVSLSVTQENPIVDINFEFEDLDLDTIWSSGSVGFNRKAQAPKIYTHDETLETINLSKISDEELSFKQKVHNIDLTSEIKIKKVTYLDGEIKDVDIYMLSSKNDEIMLLPMQFKVPGQGNVRINGVIYRDNNFPKLVGKIDAYGENLQDFLNWIKFESQNLRLDHLKEYMLYSDILLNPNMMKLNNLYLNVNNDESEFLGHIMIDDSQKTSQVTNKFRVSSFNADNYFLVSGQNAYLSPGRLLKKVLWLNEISSDNIFDIEFEKLTYKGEDFYDQAVTLQFGQGYIDIKDLKLKSDMTDLAADISVNISGKEPIFNMKVKADSFSYQSLQDNEILGTKHNSVADQFFALPSLEGFKGGISLDIANLELDGLKMTDATLIGDLEKGTMADAKISFNLYGSNFTYEGLLGLRYAKTISGIFAYSNVELQRLLPNLLQLDNVEGLANISGKISASAHEKDKFLEHITSEINFNVALPTIKGYGLKDLVNKMFYPRYYKEELMEPEKILFNPDSETALNNAKGNVKIYRDRDNSFNIDFTGPFINGIISGSTDIVKKDVNGLAKIVFLTGDSKKQYPIHIATSLKGKFDNFSHATNLDQVRHRLGLKKSIEMPKDQTQSSSQNSNTQPNLVEEQKITNN